MGESRFSRPRRQLRWKLTFSYTVVTVAVLITLVAAAGILTIVTSPASEWLAGFQAETIACASEARPFLEATPPDSTLLEAWLRAVVAEDEWGVVIDPSAAFVAANRREDEFEVLPGQAFVDGRAPEDSQYLVEQALEGRSEVLKLDDGTALAVAPILSEGEEVLGVLYVRSFARTLVFGRRLLWLLFGLGFSAIWLSLLASLIGTLFGAYASRGLVRRLENLSRAAREWGQGNFAATVQDTSPDEIGQLARGLGQMARQLQDLLQARQDLATLEERNRLARDLHDSVKQRAFATTMMLGAAKDCRERDPEAVWEMIDEAQFLSSQVQQELTNLIHELRPVELGGKGLVAALREYGARWSSQTGIEFGLVLHGEGAIPPEVEQALFRLAQEALTNVSRHAEAREVKITLVCTEVAITLKVADDGRGFDSASVEGKGLGLRSMQERIEALGGELIVESAPGAGASLVARCSLNQVNTGGSS